jgi:periplasmic divalent cation tolerance protein
MQVGDQAMPEFVQVLTTVGKQEEAKTIARALVDQRLASCVQILGPLTSVYRWKGEVETAEEWQCLIKTRRDLYPEVERAIRQLHPYEVPEILATPILAGSADYLKWIEENVGQ